jgi:hypothetical protein
MTTLPATPEDVLAIARELNCARNELSHITYGMSVLEAHATLHADGKSAEARAAQALLALSESLAYGEMRSDKAKTQRRIADLQARIDAYDRAIKARELALREAGK